VSIEPGNPLADGLTCHGVRRSGWWVFACTFAILLAGAAPGLYLRDSGELTTAAFSLGVAHETGFALWCLLAKAVALLPLGEIAFRINVFSALCGALAAWLVYRVVRALGGPEDHAAEVAGAGAALLLVSGFTFFKSSTVAEVYAPTAAAIALVLRLMQRSAAGDRRAALLVALIGGLSLGLHAQLRVLLGPPCLIYAVWRLRKGDRWPLYAPAAVALGAAVVSYLPLRASRAPIADWADPRTLGQMIGHLSASRIRAAFADQMFTRDLAVLGHHARMFAAQIESQLAIPALVAAVGGLGWLLTRKSNAAARVLGVLIAVMLAGDALYSVWINPMGLEDLQDGAPTALALALGAGVGVYALARRAPRGAPYLAGALAVLICIPAALAEIDGKRGLDGEAGAWTRAALAQAGPRALVLTSSDDLSAGALYAQGVTGARPDVTALVRQQLWDGKLVAQRIAHAGSEVHALDPWRSRSIAERERDEAAMLRALVRGELPRREIWWEPGSDSPPVARDTVEPAVPLFHLSAAAVAPADARMLAEQVEALLWPARDPQARRMRAVALVALGRAYFERDDLPRAGALYEAALGQRPGDLSAATNLAVVRARRGDLKGADALCVDVLARDATRNVARLNSGRYRVALGDLDGAEAQFTVARARAPGDAAPLVGLSRVALLRGRRDQALRLVREARVLEPQDSEARMLEQELKTGPPTTKGQE
jgi:Flp pilus assembly protein TadD